jgi:cytochrome c oxidase cbb3-type subunit IV
MYKEVLRSIEGIEIYPIISLLIFFCFFVGLLAWYLLADGDRLQRLADLPLDQETATSVPEENGGKPS